MKNVLLTLGRLPKCLDLVRALSLAGCRVVIAEPFGWHPCRVSRHVSNSCRVTAPNVDRERYLQELAAIIARERIDLVVPVSEEIMHVAALQPLIGDPVRLFAQDRSTLLALHDKARFVERAAEQGLPVPETHPLGGREAAELAARDEVIVKFIYSCAGAGMKLVPQGATLPDPVPGRPAVVQRRIEGREVSTFSIADQGRVIVTAVYEGTVRSGTTAVAMRRLDHEPAVTRWIEQFVGGIGFNGFVSFDFIIDDTGDAYAIECNPRVSSGIHFLEPTTLAAAILDPAGTKAVAFRETTRLQQFYTCLTETQRAVFRWREFRTNLAHLLRSRDVMWNLDDPLPFLLMTPLSFEILRRVIVQGMSFGEAAVIDIDWLADAA